MTAANCEIKNIENNYTNFDDIKISTMTIIGSTNWKIDTKKLFDSLPVVPYTVIPKKRGRKPKQVKEEPNKDLKEGSIITLIYKDKLRGVLLKDKKSDEESGYFRNSLTVVIYVGKMINTKISDNGKFQMTGCKNDEHAEKCVKYIWKYIQEMTDKTICKVNGKTAECHFNTHMTNIDFNLGFRISRESLDKHINKITEYNSILETSFGYTGVNIKMKLDKSINPPVKKLVLEDNDWKLVTIPYEEYNSLLNPKDKKKEKKDRNHTFLVFQSGKVILSSKHIIYMRSIYNTFIDMIKKIKPEIEERIISEPST